MFELMGVICLGLVVFGVIGLGSKKNRDDKEYVANLKEVSSLGFQWFIMLPVLCIGGLITIIMLSR